jgi:hypothetical protein
VSEPTANPHRGEVEITLKADGGEKTFVLRPTFQALAEIEGRAGTGVVALARKAAAGELGIGEAAAIVAAGLRAAGEPAGHDKVGEMVFRTGLIEVLPAVGAFLVAGLSGGAPPGEDGAAAGES